MGFAAAPGADEGDVELVAGGVGAEELGPRQDESGGSGESDGFEEVASFHGASLAWRRVVKPQSGDMESRNALDCPVIHLGLPARRYCSFDGSPAISE